MLVGRVVTGCCWPWVSSLTRSEKKTVYRVRTRWAIEGRLALDLLWERQVGGRAKTTKTLHKTRAA
ncbi:MAG: hypothetical protein JOZ53_05870 [Planctomycetaceae bacterium]|nr:hypothetical protein [Planctomycetaceae bacterium]